MKHVAAQLQLDPLLPRWGVPTNAARLLFTGWRALYHLLMEKQILLPPGPFDFGVFNVIHRQALEILGHLQGGHVQFVHVPIVWKPLNQVEHYVPKNRLISHTGSVELLSFHDDSEPPLGLVYDADVQRLGHDDDVEICRRVTAGICLYTTLHHDHWIFYHGPILLRMGCSGKYASLGCAVFHPSVQGIQCPAWSVRRGGRQAFPGSYDDSSSPQHPPNQGRGAALPGSVLGARGAALSIICGCQLPASPKHADGAVPGGGGDAWPACCVHPCFSSLGSEFKCVLPKDLPGAESQWNGSGWRKSWSKKGVIICHVVYYDEV